MNNLLKRACSRSTNFVKDRIKQAIPGSLKESCANHQEIQRSIINQYLQHKMQNVTPYINIKDAGFRVYSQFEEDGIILYILAMIGFKTRRVVEMCCGSGEECMATNLMLNHGFDGYLFDGSEENISSANRFFGSKKDASFIRPYSRTPGLQRRMLMTCSTEVVARVRSIFSHLIWTVTTIGF
jgi:hypothetical protein